MSDERWHIELQLTDARSNKFWRARSVGSALEINYGRIGAKGQRQVKRYDSAADSVGELQKQADAKRKKGYVDSTPPQLPETATDLADAAPAAAATGSPGDEHVDLLLELGERRIELRLTLSGASVQTLAVERYRADDDARAAYRRLRDALADEGYRQV